MHTVHPHLTVLHLDAHPDLYDEFEGDRFSHACPFARILEERLAARVIQVGIRATTGHLRDQAARFDVEVQGSQVRFMGLGFGHGVGLCQEGAMARARSGADAAAILDAYFYGVRLDVWPTAGFPVPLPSSASLPPSAPPEGPAAAIRPGG